MQLVDRLLKLLELAVRPVEAAHGCPVSPLLGHVRARDVEELHEQLAGEQAEAATLGKADLGHFARDDQLVGPVGGGANDAQRFGAGLGHTVYLE